MLSSSAPVSDWRVCHNMSEAFETQNSIATFAAAEADRIRNLIREYDHQLIHPIYARLFNKPNIVSYFEFADVLEDNYSSKKKQDDSLVYGRGGSYHHSMNRIKSLISDPFKIEAIRGVGHILTYEGKWISAPRVAKEDWGVVARRLLANSIHADVSSYSRISNYTNGVNYELPSLSINSLDHKKLDLPKLRSAAKHEEVAFLFSDGQNEEIIFISAVERSILDLLDRYGGYFQSQHWMSAQGHVSTRTLRQGIATLNVKLQDAGIEARINSEPIGFGIGPELRLSAERIVCDGSIPGFFPIIQGQIGTQEVTIWATDDEYKQMPRIYLRPYSESEGLWSLVSFSNLDGEVLFVEVPELHTEILSVLIKNGLSPEAVLEHARTLKKRLDTYKKSFDRLMERLLKAGVIDEIPEHSRGQISLPTI